MEHYISILVIITIKFKIYFEYHLIEDVLGAHWCTGCDPH